MPIVVDTSVALKWTLPEEHQAEAIQLLNDCIRLQTPLLAPHLLLHEAANVFATQVVDQLLTPTAVPAALAQSLSVVTFRTFDFTLAERAVEIAVAARRRPFGFDAQFLALAEREGCDFWTADRAFFDALHETFPQVRWIGAYTSPLPTPPA